MENVEWIRPPEAKCLLVLAHGAGAGMRHPFMDAVARRLADRDIATMRYQFPYMSRGSRRPDPPGTLIATVREAVDLARQAEPALPLIAGGKSMGGRMTSMAAAAEPLPGVRGLVFLGFPLHAAGKPSSARGDHLSGVQIPMLFLQGTNDKLADLDLLRPVCKSLGARAHLHAVPEADHSFHVPRRTGRTDAEILDELADAILRWFSGIQI